MKNFIALDNPQDIFNYVGTIWRSDIFRQSHQDSDGYIHGMIEKFSQTPRIFFDMHLERLESEVLIYFYMPGLRDLSFKNELWVDSYLERPELQALKDCYGQYTSTQSEAIRLFLASERKRCETQPYNDIEKMIGQYTVSSYQWAKIWKNSWQEVETYVQLFLNNPDKKEALEKHLQWLKEKQAQSQTGVVFEAEAQAYSDVHQSMFKSSYNPVN